MVSAFLSQKCLRLSTRGNYEILCLGACCWNTTTATSRLRKSINKQSSTLLSHYLFMASQINALKCQRNQFGCLKEKNIVPRRFDQQILVSVSVFQWSGFVFPFPFCFPAHILHFPLSRSETKQFIHILVQHILQSPNGTVAGIGSSPPKTLNCISRSKWTDAYFTVQTSLFGSRLCLFQ